MSNPIPDLLALTSIADGSQRLAAPIRNNNSAIQAAVNELIAALGGGAANQFLEAVDATHVQWAGGYTAYNPAWTATGTAPAIGNAAVLGRYLQIGKKVHCYGQITFGSTSTFGTGTYAFALPVAASSASLRALGTIELFRNSTNAYYLATADTTSPTAIQFLYPVSFGGTITQVGQTTPWAWAVNDFISWNFTYEAA